MIVCQSLQEYRAAGIKYEVLETLIHKHPELTNTLILVDTSVGFGEIVAIFPMHKDCSKQELESLRNSVGVICEIKNNNTPKGK